MLQTMRADPPLPAPALRAMPWAVAFVAAAVYLATRLHAHTYPAVQLAFSAKEAQGLGDCLLHPAYLLHPHLLRLLAAPARLLGADPDLIHLGQALSALGAALAASLLYRVLADLVDNWRCALIAVCVFCASYAVWFTAAEALPHAPALLPGVLGLWLLMGGQGPPTPLRCALAGLLGGAASLLDAGALLWFAPLALAAARGQSGRPASAALRAALAGLTPLLVFAGALALAWPRARLMSPGLDFPSWIALASPGFAAEPGAHGIFDYLKTFKYALLYRTPWYVGLPVALAFLGLPWAWKRRPVATLIFGLWAGGGAVRALGSDPVQIAVWTPAMPGVAGLLALSLDAALQRPAMRRLNKASVLAAALTILVLTGDNGGWLPRFEGLDGYKESEAAARRLAELSHSPADVILVPEGYLEFLLPYRYGLRSVIHPLMIQQASAAAGVGPDAWLAAAIRDALDSGASIFAHDGFLDPGSPLRARVFDEILPGPGETPEGFAPPFVFHLWRSAESSPGGGGAAG